METMANKEDKSRMELRLSSSDKELFEYARQLSGFTTLAEFVRRAVREKAESIIASHNQIIASKRDREIFYDALMAPPEANQGLKDAIGLYKEKL
jgi:uncharacterized protein (DUF1778 family)